MRQLNFYGFRKIKADPLRIKEAEVSEESKYWKFRHDKFQRGRPDLLSEIRKSTHNENADKQEVETLKNEVSALKETISNMGRDIEKLAAVVSNFMQTQTSYAPEYGAAKKRKLIHEAHPSPVRSTNVQRVLSDLAGPDMDPVPIGSMYCVGAGAGLDGVDPYVPGNLQPADPVGRVESAGATSFTSQDDEFLTKIFALDPTEEISILDTVGVPDLSLSMMTKPAAEVDPVLVDQLRGAVSMLSKEMQKMFVDRIVATIADPERFGQQVDAMASLATSAAAEAKRRLASAGLSPEDPECVSLASAVLGAYLSRYSTQQQAPEPAVPAAFTQI